MIPLKPLVCLFAHFPLTRVRHSVLLGLVLFVAYPLSLIGQTLWAPKVDLEFEHNRYVEFWSDTVGEDVAYSLYLPPGYETEVNRRYPVVYYLHGQNNLMTGFDNMSPNYHDAMVAGRFPEAIIVGVNGVLNSWYIDGDYSGLPMESVIMDDLVPHIDEAYRTIATRLGRSMEGSSMGAYGAMRLGFKYPEVFSSIVAVGGGRYDYEGGYNGLMELVDDFTVPAHASTDLPYWLTSRGSEDYISEMSPLSLLMENEDALRGRMTVRMADGEYDWHRYGALLWENILQQYGISVSHEIVPDIEHWGVMTMKALLENEVSYHESVGFGVLPVLEPIEDIVFGTDAIEPAVSARGYDGSFELGIVRGHAIVSAGKIQATGVGEVVVRVSIPATDNSAALGVEHSFRVEEIDSPNEDTDGDGVKDLLESALGMDRLVPDAERFPSFQYGEQADSLLIEIEYQANRTDFRYVTEVSSDLVNWELGGETLEADNRLVRTELFSRDDVRRFVRYRVEKIDQ